MQGENSVTNGVHVGAVVNKMYVQLCQHHNGRGRKGEGLLYSDRTSHSNVSPWQQYSHARVSKPLRALLRNEERSRMHTIHLRNNNQSSNTILDRARPC